MQGEDVLITPGRVFIDVDGVKLLGFGIQPGRRRVYDFGLAEHLESAEPLQDGICDLVVASLGSIPVLQENLDH